MIPEEALALGRVAREHSGVELSPVAFLVLAGGQLRIAMLPDYAREPRPPVFRTLRSLCDNEGLQVEQLIFMTEVYTKVGEMSYPSLLDDPVAQDAICVASIFPDGTGRLLLQTFVITPKLEQSEIAWGDIIEPVFSEESRQYQELMSFFGK